MLEKISAMAMIHAHLCTSAQPTATELLAIKEAGYQTIVNIALTDASPHLDGEDKICLDLGLEYIHVPLSWEYPDSGTALFILEMIDHLVQRQKVWLHCAKNYRVASLMALYRQYYLGMAVDEVDHLLHEVWQPNETWVGLMHAVRLQLQARQSTAELSQLS